jgi:hypothetical protein
MVRGLNDDDSAAPTEITVGGIFEAAEYVDATSLLSIQPSHGDPSRRTGWIIIMFGAAFFGAVTFDPPLSKQARVTPEKAPVQRGGAIPDIERENDICRSSDCIS